MVLISGKIIGLTATDATHDRVIDEKRRASFISLINSAGSTGYMGRPAMSYEKNAAP